jgi:hypothetical protein
VDAPRSMRCIIKCDCRLCFADILLPCVDTLARISNSNSFKGLSRFGHSECLVASRTFCLSQEALGLNLHSFDESHADWLTNQSYSLFIFQQLATLAGVQRLICSSTSLSLGKYCACVSEIDCGIPFCNHFRTVAFVPFSHRR